MNTALVIAAACAGGLLWKQRRLRRLDDWRDLAHELGLTFRDLGAAGIEVDVPGAKRPVRVERESGGVRLWTVYPVAAGPRFCAVPRAQWYSGRGEVLRLEDWFGPPVTIATRWNFFAHHVLLTRELVPTQRVLGAEPGAMMEILGIDFRDATLLSYRRVVELHLPDPQRSAPSALAALGAVAEVAEADLFGLGVLLGLPDAVLEREPRTLDGGGPVVVRTGGAWPCRFEIDSVDEAVFTRARVGAHAGLVPFEARLSGGRVDGSLPRGFVPIEAVPLLPGVGDALLRSDGRDLVVQWPEVVTAPATLQSAARLLALLTRRENRL